MATPDDLEEFRSCQLTFHATTAPWNDMSRGAEHWLSGPDEVATALGMRGVISAGMKNEDEGLFPVQHGYWQRIMRAAAAKEASGDGHGAHGHGSLTAEDRRAANAQAGAGRAEAR